MLAHIRYFMYTHQSYLQASLLRTLSPKLARSLAPRLRRAKFCWEGKNFSLATILGILKFTAYVFLTHYGTTNWPVLPLPRPGTKWSSESPRPSDQGYLVSTIRVSGRSPESQPTKFSPLIPFRIFRLLIPKYQISLG